MALERTVDQRFRLDEKLGEGGFGEVWLAEDLVAGGQVALKLLRPEIAARPKALERFAREVEVLRAIEHEHVVRLVAARTDTAPHYLAMEYVRGETLRDVMWRRASSGRSFSPEEIEHVVARLASALEAIHAHGAVHRDLKPTNVMVDVRDGAIDRVCLLDLGIARVQVDASDQTTVGRMMGTLMYMSPEQIRGDAADGRADQFALAVIAYELATLRRPFAQGADGRPVAISQGAISSEGDNAHVEVARRIVFEPRPRAAPFRPELGRAFDDALQRALGFAPTERFESCAAFASAVAAAIHAAPEREVAPRPETEAAVDSLTRSIEAPVLTAVMPRDLTTPGVAAPTRPTPPPRARPLGTVAVGAFLLAVTVGVATVVATRTEGPTVERVTPAPPEAPGVSATRGPEAGEAVAERGDAPTANAEPGDGAGANSKQRDAPLPNGANGDGSGAASAKRDTPPQNGALADGSGAAAKERSAANQRDVAKATAGAKKRAPPPPPEAPAPKPPPDPFAYDASDPASVVRAAKALEAAASRLAANDARTSITRCASLAAMRAAAPELEACLKRFRAAQ